MRDGQVRLRDLDSESGTFVNDERIAPERIVHAGDRMRVGRLEFEILIERSTHATKADPVDEFVSEMLAQADEEERAVRRSDPELRKFQLGPNEVSNDEQVEPEKEDKLTALRKKVPRKKPPGKLPPPPAITSESSTSAAKETLKKIFEKPKPKRPDY